MKSNISKIEFFENRFKVKCLISGGQWSYRNRKKHKCDCNCGCQSYYNLEKRNRGREREFGRLLGYKRFRLDHRDIWYTDIKDQLIILHRGKPKPKYGGKKLPKFFSVIK